MDFPKVLQPGQAGKIRVKIETGNGPGSFVKSVTIKSNDPDQPSVQVDFLFTIK